MNFTYAAEWAGKVANALRAQGKINPFFLAVNWGWRVIMIEEDDNPFLLPCLAEWDGGPRAIYIFVSTLRRCEGESEEILHRACAHELFHGLVALHYRPLNFVATDYPRLNFKEEEIAAQVFSETLLGA